MDELFNVKGDGFVYTFERGVLCSLEYGELELLYKPVIPNLWRAPTDNDNGFGNFFDYAKRFMPAVKWKNAGTRQSALYWHKRETEDGIEVVSEWKNPLCRKLQIIYSIYKDGSLDIELVMLPKRIDAMRCGLQFVLPRDFGKVTWYGRGPHECYPDRKTGARLSMHTATVEDIGHRYVRPQENGARCDVRHLSVSSGARAVRVKDLSGDGLIFSAWHYEQDDLTAASHDYKLHRKSLTTLNIDSVMCGVGGDLPGTTALHKEYRMPGNKEYRMRIGLSF